MPMGQLSGQWEPIETSGKLFPDGSAIDRLRENRLVLWQHKEHTIGLLVTYKGSTYAAARLDTALEELLRLPDRTEDCGTVGDLITGLSGRIASHVPLDESAKVLLASFILCTWVVDCLPSAPVLNLWGPAGTENPLLDLLSCVCRRPLRLTEPSVRHQQPAEFQRHCCYLLQRLAPQHGLEEFCFHNSFATISTKRILIIVMPGKIMA